VLILGEVDRFGCGKQSLATWGWFRPKIPAGNDDA
jgi:hypothetical protein